MRLRTFALMLAAAIPAAASAQQMDHGKHTGPAAPCPLHLTTLNLSPAQQMVVDSIRSAHQASMKALMPQHDSAAMARRMAAGMKMSDSSMKMTAEAKASMQASMVAAVALIRATLDDAQRVVFDAAVSAHESKMKAMKEKGDHDCMACCMECMGHGGHGSLQNPRDD